ncbi:MAG: DUF3788 domain-containing protein [Candidatus Cloacimonetes bacterium]|nr:DUF3788 domain-containing protein [Candidatus Cloacimonadota bacterium]
MATSIYDEKLIKPTDEMLAYKLGMTKNYLNIISEFIANKYGSFKTEWKFYNKKSGWILKLFNKNGMFCLSCLVISIFEQHLHLETKLLI